MLSTQPSPRLNSSNHPLAGCLLPQETHVELAAIVGQDWWKGLRAVQEGRVVLVDGNQMFNRPGPRLVDALEFLAGLLHGRHDLIPEGFPWEMWAQP
jgi:iron complex transport system substrate-binding protein